MSRLKFNPFTGEFDLVSGGVEIGVDDAIGGIEGSVIFIGGSTLSQDNPNFYWDNTNNFLGIGINTSLSAHLHIVPSSTNSAIQIDSATDAAGGTGEIRFTELPTNGASYVGFKAPDDVSTTVVWQLPTSDGGNGQLLRTDGGGALSWASAGSGQIFAPTGASYILVSSDTSLSQSRLLTGTANQVVVTDGGALGNIVLSTPQDIASTSAVEFGGLKLNLFTEGAVIFAGLGGTLSSDAGLQYNSTNPSLKVQGRDVHRYAYFLMRS